MAYLHCADLHLHTLEPTKLMCGLHNVGSSKGHLVWVKNLGTNFGIGISTLSIRSYYLCLNPNKIMDMVYNFVIAADA